MSVEIWSKVNDHIVEEDKRKGHMLNMDQLKHHLKWMTCTYVCLIFDLASVLHKWIEKCDASTIRVICLFML